MEFTQSFMDGDWRCHSPFWRFVSEFGAQVTGINPYIRSHAFASNIFRISNDADAKALCRLGELAAEYCAKIQTLSQEISIASPDILLFLTGPNYDQYIARIFPGIEFT